jgi:hypothetical protein
MRGKKPQHVYLPASRVFRCNTCQAQIAIHQGKDKRYPVDVEPNPHNPSEFRYVANRGNHQNLTPWHTCKTHIERRRRADFDTRLAALKRAEGSELQPLLKEQMDAMQAVQGQGDDAVLKAIKPISDRILPVCEKYKAQYDQLATEFPEYKDRLYLPLF